MSSAYLILTLYDPKFFTEHASLIFRPAGTVIFSMVSVNSGSSDSAENRKKRKIIYQKSIGVTEKIQLEIVSNTNDSPTPLKKRHSITLSLINRVILFYYTLNRIHLILLKCNTTTRSLSPLTAKQQINERIQKKKRKKKTS